MYIRICTHTKNQSKCSLSAESIIMYLIIPTGNTLMIYSVGRRFIRHEHTNCGIPQTIPPIRHLESQSPDYEDCIQRCLENSGCDAFVVYVGICYFKNTRCRDDLFNQFRATTFLLDGNLIWLQS